MKTKTTSPTRAAKQLKSGIQPESQPMMAELYRRAQARLRKPRKSRRMEAGVLKSAASPQRLLHELQVHQVELEMQNAELHEARDRMEALLEKYTDLYDFAPVGHFSLDKLGRITEVNLTGAVLLGVERSRLVNQLLPRFVAPASRPDFLAFLKRVFAETGKQVCEAALLKPDAAVFWGSIHGTTASSANSPQKWCRLAVSDITSLKQAEEAQRRAEVLADSNLELRREIIRRQKVEESLRQSEQHQCRLLEQSHLMQEKLRHLSRQVLRAQEDERKRISRELHDVIAQTLTGINIRLATLKKEASVNTKGLARNIARTQRLVEKSVDLVHRFALELRPAVLDDLGLIPALHSFMKSFATRTGIHASLMTHALKIDSLDAAERTVLFRVAQEALVNVDRHAHASRVEVSIQKLPEGICMKIIDDGKSFKVDHVLHGKGGERLGLLGMRERLEMVGGHFDVESAQGKGTTVIAQLPNDNTARGGAAENPLTEPVQTKRPELD
jgi:PAS domain S-box-containing protein